MKGFSIQPAVQGIYPAVCHIGDIYVPLTEEGLARLKTAAAAPPAEFYRAFLEVVGVSTYLKERIAELWREGDVGERTRQLQQAIKQFPGR
jgi:hypothetical protein